MNVLVTGGTGFIGSALVARLLAEGHQVTVLTRDTTRAKALLGERIAAVSSLDHLDAQVAPDVIVNLAGENLAKHRWNTRWKKEFIKSRVGTTERLISYIGTAPRKPRVLVSGSAIGYYGARGDEELDETSPPSDEYQSELCRMWEAAAQRAKLQGVRVCVVRTGVVLGKDGALKQMLLPFRLGLGGRFGDGRQWMSWIHIDDEVGLILHLINNENLSGAFNATSPEPSTNREFVQALARTLQRPAFMNMPAFIARLLIGEMAQLLLTGQKVLPKRTQESGYRFRYPTLADALAGILDR